MVVSLITYAFLTIRFIFGWWHCSSAGVMPVDNEGGSKDSIGTFIFTKSQWFQISSASLESSPVKHSLSDNGLLWKSHQCIQCVYKGIKPTYIIHGEINENNSFSNPGVLKSLWLCYLLNYYISGIHFMGQWLLSLTKSSTIFISRITIQHIKLWYDKTIKDGWPGVLALYNIQARVSFSKKFQDLIMGQFSHYFYLECENSA